MEFWVVLGIEQTKDEEAIHAAYREKLQLVHPEEHPEEFMQLRAAYDEALSYARKTEEDEEGPSTPIDLWICRVEEVYNDISRRVSVDEWKALLADEVCQGLDSRIDARDALLKFGMECFYMPNDVWELIINTFSIRECYDELCEKFPKGYIDNGVILGADGMPNVPYDLYGEGYTGNPDAFIKLWYKARDERRSGNLDACEATIADMRSLGVPHPYDRLAEAELFYVREEKDKAIETIDRLIEEYPSDIGIRIFHGDAYRLIKEDCETALADFEFVLEKRPKHLQARWGKAECLRGLGKLEEAKDIYLHLHHQMPYDGNFTERIEKINEELAQQYEQKVAEQPENFQLRMDYAWSLLQRKEHDKARATVAEADPSTVAEKCDYYNFCTKLALNCDRFEEALSSATEWEKNIRELPEGETDEEKRRKGKLGESIHLQAVALFGLKDYDKTLERLDAAEAVQPDMSELFNLRRLVYHRRREFDKAVEQAEKVVKLDPGYMSWFSLGYEQFEQGDMSSAYQSFGEALDYAKVLQAYMYRARILCWYGEWDAFKEAIEFLEQGGVDANDAGLRYLKARLLHHEEKKEEALEIYKSIIAEYEKEAEENDGADCDFIHEVYHLCADIEDDFGRDVDEVLAIVEKGLAAKEDHYPLLDLKNYLLYHKKKDQEAIIALNTRILELYPGNVYANERIGDALYFIDRYEEAVEYYLKQEKVRDSGWVQEVLGLCLMYLERYDEAEPHFLKAVELEPERIRAKANLGLMYERRWNPEKDAYDFDLSLPLQEEAVRLNDEREEDKRSRAYRVWLARCLARMGRYDEAMAVYRKNFELYGDEEDARKEVELYMECGRFAEGEKLLDKYHAEGKLDDVYLVMKADFRYDQDKPRDFLKYIGKMADGARKYSKLAYYYEDSDKKKERLESLKWFSKALEEDDTRSDYMIGYIRALYDAGKVDEAQTLARKAMDEIEKMKNHGWRIGLYLTEVAMVHLAVGNPDFAKPYIDRALTCPLCDHCRYKRCKDAYVALARYYKAKGMYEECAKVCRDTLAFAPDDSTLRVMLKQLKKERKIK